MSSNICSIDCAACGYRVVAVGPVRVATAEEVSRYHVGMMIADAECALCGAKYTAWCDDRSARMRTHTEEFPDVVNSRWGAGEPRYRNFDAQEAERDGETYFFDLSYRSTFRDEPSDYDRGLPLHEIEAVVREYRERKATAKEKGRGRCGVNVKKVPSI